MDLREVRLQLLALDVYGFGAQEARYRQLCSDQLMLVGFEVDLDFEAVRLRVGSPGQGVDQGGRDLLPEAALERSDAVRQRKLLLAAEESQLDLRLVRGARNLLDLHEHRMIGKPAQQFAANNKLFQTILDTEDDLSSLKIKLDGKESVFQLENVKLYIPNLATIRPDEVNIARVPVGQIYVLRNLTEIHAI